MIKRRQGRRGVAIWLTLGALLTAAWWLAGPAQLGGGTAYVTTQGTSMAPRFHSGDLAVVRRAAAYRVGDVVAYRSSLFHSVVMHRLVAVEGGRYIFKGDTNAWRDPEKPAREHLIGKLVLRVPQGGAWLARLSDPAALALISFGLRASGGTAATVRRKRRRAPVSQRAGLSGISRTVSTLPPSLRTAAALTAAAGILGLALAALAWTSPLNAPATAAERADGQMRFSYTAAVGRTPAYDTTTARSPDPVFRRLANTVDVHFTYSGAPGSVSVSARLATPDGWHSTVPLKAWSRVTADGHEGTVRLDLEAFDARAEAAAAVTGLTAGPISIAITPRVNTGDGSVFEPTLKLSLSPLQLALVGDAKDLTVTDSTMTARSISAPRTFRLFGGQLSVDMARTISLVLLFGALVSAGAIGLIALRTAPADEASAIRRRYGPLLVRVHPMPPPPGRPVIDVAMFATLVRLAERYGLLILHWTGDDVETFIVPDEGGTYRYTARAQPRHP